MLRRLAPSATRMNAYHFVQSTSLQRMKKKIASNSFISKLYFRSVLALLVLLLVCSTGYDLFKRDSSIEPHRLLTAFSVYTNGKKLFKISTENPCNIRCLNGIRVFSTFWVVFGHRFLIEFLMMPMKNPTAILTLRDRWFFWILTGAEFAVDTFLVMGGLLVTTTLLRAFEKRRFSYPKFLLNRYLRYVPVIAAATLLTFPVFKLTNDHLLEDLKQSCECRWWTNLLMINNYFYSERMCLSHLWYLAVDFQLFAVSPILVYLLWKFTWKAFWALPALIVGSSIYLVHACLQSVAIKGQYLRSQIYFPTHTRIGPWILGMMLGYIFYQLRGIKCQISRKLSFLLWSLTLFCMWLAAYFSLFLIRTGEHLELLDNAIFMGIKRLIWALGLAWIIFACQKLETGGFIRWLLCLNFWQPISRLTLSIYVTYNFYVFFNIEQREDIIDFELSSYVSLLNGTA